VISAYQSIGGAILVLTVPTNPTKKIVSIGHVLKANFGAITPNAFPSLTYVMGSTIVIRVKMKAKVFVRGLSATQPLSSLVLEVPSSAFP